MLRSRQGYLEDYHRHRLSSLLLVLFSVSAIIESKVPRQICCRRVATFRKEERGLRWNRTAPVAPEWIEGSKEKVGGHRRHCLGVHTLEEAMQIRERRPRRQIRRSRWRNLVGPRRVERAYSLATPRRETIEPRTRRRNGRKDACLSQRRNHEQTIIRHLARRVDEEDLPPAGTDNRIELDPIFRQR